MTRNGPCHQSGITQTYNLYFTTDLQFGHCFRVNARNNAVPTIIINPKISVFVAPGDSSVVWLRQSAQKVSGWGRHTSEQYFRSPSECPVPGRIRDEHLAHREKNRIIYGHSAFTYQS